MKKKHSGSKHIGPASGKAVGGMGHGGGNLKFGHASQSVGVSPAKDKMAKNVANHMGEKDQFGDNHDQDDDIIETGAAMKGPKKAHNPY